MTELEDLKKSWDALDKQLQKTPLTDDKWIIGLIRRKKEEATDNLQKLARLNRLSLWIGGAAIAIIVAVWKLLPALGASAETEQRFLPLLAFLAASIAIGLLWDNQTYKQMKDIRIDEMTVLEVTRRFVTLQRWTRAEVIIFSLWGAAFFTIYYRVMDFHLLGGAAQTCIIIGFIALYAVILYILYKKQVFKYLRHIQKNLKDLRELCTE